MARSALFLLALALTGCSLLSGRDSPSPGAPAGADNASPSPARGQSGEGLALYLNTLRELVEGDPVTQADAFRTAQAAADASPTTTNRMNLALALATPGHPSANPAEAQRLLSALLAQGDALLPEERILALVHLKDVEQRLILNAEAERLQRAAVAAAAERNDQSAQRLAAALEENRQLKLALDEARAKLDAITNIERSIRERDNGANPQ
jgi:hypothetical protein